MFGIPSVGFDFGFDALLGFLDFRFGLRWLDSL